MMTTVNNQSIPVDSYSRLLPVRHGASAQESKVKAIQERINRLIPSRKPVTGPNTLNYEQMYGLFLQTAQALAATEGRTFVIDEHNSEAVGSLVAYLTGQIGRSSLDLRKGICLYGPSGAGKTFLMTVFRLLCETVPLPDHQFQIQLTSRISHLVESARSSTAINPYLVGTLCLDDLGNELPVVKLYSNPIAVLDMILIERTQSFVESGLITHATTPMAPHSLEYRYGLHIYDRCRQLFNFVAVGTNDSPSRR